MPVYFGVDGGGLASSIEIVNMLAKIEALKVTMAERSANGKEASGRYKKHDTARKVYLDVVALPALRYGKLPPAADARLLFDLPGDDEIQGTEKAEMDVFYEKHKKDPRSTRSASYSLDQQQQTSLLSWVARNPAGYVAPAPAPRGAPPIFRLSRRDTHDYEGCTLGQLAADRDLKTLRANATVPGGETLLWIASERYTWRFPEQIRLFLALQDLERGGCTTVGNSREGRQVVSARHARAAYRVHARAQLQPRGGEADPFASPGVADAGSSSGSGGSSAGSGGGGGGSSSGSSSSGGSSSNAAGKRRVGSSSAADSSTAGSSTAGSRSAAGSRAAGSSSAAGSSAAGSVAGGSAAGSSDADGATRTRGSSDDDIDGNLYETVDPAFATINAISPAQVAFFNSTVAGMSDHPYSSWNRLRVEPPDATCTDCFGDGSTSEWEVLPIHFYSPTKIWGARHGIQMPCPRHGWAHARFVTVYDEWRQVSARCCCCCCCCCC